MLQRVQHFEPPNLKNDGTLDADYALPGSVLSILPAHLATHDETRLDGINSGETSIIAGLSSPRCVIWSRDEKVETGGEKVRHDGHQLHPGSRLMCN